MQRFVPQFKSLLYLHAAARPSPRQRIFTLTFQLQLMIQAQNVGRLAACSILASFANLAVSPRLVLSSSRGRRRRRRAAAAAGNEKGREHGGGAVAELCHRDKWRKK